MANLDFTKGELKESLIEGFLKVFDNPKGPELSYLDNCGMLYKVIDGSLVGKKAFKKNDYEYCWKEDL